jgi:hypothetical protein
MYRKSSLNVIPHVTLRKGLRYFFDALTQKNHDLPVFQKLLN